ncbi:MAG TPA: exopolysaccharide biosynthesis protein [Caulobacteraceae bacterium]|jgi:hypothetical protein|nr:exopolysaccharide biosynthesis protein [Caulobacteraceae bacterium]
MPKTPKLDRRSLVAAMRPLLRSRKESLSVGELMARLEDADGPGPVLFALTLPVLTPMPPGVSMVLALPLLLVAPQIALGRQRLWMPDWLEQRTISRKDLVKLLKRVLPPLVRFESIVKPRLGFLTGPVGSRLVGIACTLIALVLVLPIPFANLVPSIALGAFALGLTRRDGLMVLAGYGLILAAIAVIALGVHGVTLGLHQLRSLF